MGEIIDFPNFELIPAEADEFTPDEELAEVFDPDEVPEREEEADALPIGRNLIFDPDTGQFTDTWATGDAAVVQVLQIALRVQRGVHVMFDDDFGMTEPDALIGYPDDIERRSAYQRDIQETCLAAHERVTAVGNFLFLSDPISEEAEVDLSIEIDGSDEVRLEGIPLLTHG